MLPGSTPRVTASIIKRPMPAPTSTTRRRKRAAVIPTGTAIHGRAGLWAAPDSATPSPITASVKSKLAATVYSGRSVRDMRPSSVSRLAATAANSASTHQPYQGTSAISAIPIAAAPTSRARRTRRLLSITRARSSSVGQSQRRNEDISSLIGIPLRGLNPPQRGDFPPHRRIPPGEMSGLRDFAQLLCLSQRLELLERLVLDLADALAGDVEGAPDLVERARMLAAEPVTELEDAALAVGQVLQRLPERLLGQEVGGAIERGFRLLVGDELAELRLLLVTDRLLQRNGSLRRALD